MEFRSRPFPPQINLAGSREESAFKILFAGIVGMGEEIAGLSAGRQGSKQITQIA